MVDGSLINNDKKGKSEGTPPTFASLLRVMKCLVKSGYSSEDGSSSALSPKTKRAKRLT